MPKVKVLEVVSGLGMGGAEKALISRLKYEPSAVETSILNIRPKIDSLKLPDSIQYTENQGNFSQNISFINRKIEELNPDIVIVRTPADVIRLAVVKIFFHKDVYLVFEAHSNFVTQRKFLKTFFEFMFRLAASQLNVVIAVSESVKNGPLCRSKRKTHVCYLGSDIDIEGGLLNDVDRVKFLFIGRMVDVKRPLWLIDRLAVVRSKIKIQVKCLTMVGDGPLLGKAKEMVLELGWFCYIPFTGEQLDVVPYLFQHNYLVSCSENEGLPITFYEAKLAGLRIISTPSGGGHEILNENDLLTSDFSEVEFEAALFKALNDPVPSKIDRKRISEASVWMSAERCSTSYYRALLESFENGYR